MYCKCKAIVFLTYYAEKWLFGLVMPIVIMLYLSLSVVFNLPENTSTPINSTVGSINATDLDGDSLTYSIEAGSPQFVAVNEGEVVRFTGPQLLDYESSIK